MNKLINEYIEAKEALNKYKKLEADLRIKVLDEVFSDQTPGSHTEIINGLKVKGGFKLNHKLDVKMASELFDSMTEEEQSCIKFKPSLSLKEYNDLEDVDTYILDDCITVVPAMPTLSIEVSE